MENVQDNNNTKQKKFQKQENQQSEEIEQKDINLQNSEKIQNKEIENKPNVLDILYKNEYEQFLKLSNLIGESELDKESKLTQVEEQLLDEPIQMMQNPQELEKEQKQILEDVYEKYNQDQLQQLVEQLMGERKHLLYIIERLDSERKALRVKNKDLVTTFVNAHYAPPHHPHEQHFVQFHTRLHDLNYELIHKTLVTQQVQLEQQKHYKYEIQYLKDKLERIEGKIKKERQNFKSFLSRQNNNLNDDNKSISNIGPEDQEIEKMPTQLKRINIKQFKNEDQIQGNDKAVNSKNSTKTRPLVNSASSKYLVKPTVSNNKIKQNQMKESPLMNKTMENGGKFKTETKGDKGGNYLTKNSYTNNKRTQINRNKDLNNTSVYIQPKHKHQDLNCTTITHKPSLVTDTTLQHIHLKPHNKTLQPKKPFIKL